MTAPLVERAEPASPLFCIGHSHVASVERAATLAEVPLRAFNFWNLPDAISRKGPRPEFAASLHDALAQHEGPVFSMIGGAVHVVLGMLVHPRRFDFVWPDEPELPLDAAAELLPSLAVRRLVELHLEEYLSLMDEVRRICAGPMYHIEPPPPSADAERIYADTPWGMFPGHCREVSPVSLRYKLWRVHSQVLTDWCTAAGAVMLPVPRESVDVSGFMLDRYYGDGAHANDAYGALVLEQMRRHA